MTVFFLVFLLGWILMKLMEKIAVSGNPDLPGKFKAYACGENTPKNRVNPDYSQFFPFAFFFTLIHVIALMVASIPSAANLSAWCMGITYLLLALFSLFILFRRS